MKAMLIAVTLVATSYSHVFASEPVSIETECLDQLLYINGLTHSESTPPTNRGEEYFVGMAQQKAIKIFDDRIGGDAVASEFFFYRSSQGRSQVLKALVCDDESFQEQGNCLEATFVRGHANLSARAITISEKWHIGDNKAEIFCR